MASEIIIKDELPDTDEEHDQMQSDAKSLKHTTRRTTPCDCCVACKKNITRLINGQMRVEYKLDKLLSHFNLSENYESDISCVDEITFPIESIAVLKQFEIQLEDSKFKMTLLKRFSKIEPRQKYERIKQVRIARIIIFSLFTREFLHGFVWNRRSQIDETRVKFSLFVKTIHFFYQVMNRRFPDYSLYDAQTFLQRLIKRKVVEHNGTPVNGVKNDAESDALEAENGQQSTKECTAKATPVKALKKVETPASEKLIFPIKTIRELNVLERQLQDPHYEFTLFRKWFPVSQTPTYGANTGHIVLGAIFAQGFFKQLVWNGAKKEHEALPKFSTYTNTINLFFKLMKNKFPEYSLAHAHLFFKEKIRNNTDTGLGACSNDEADDCDVNETDKFSESEKVETQTVKKIGQFRRKQLSFPLSKINDLHELEQQLKDPKYKLFLINKFYDNTKLSSFGKNKKKIWIAGRLVLGEMFAQGFLKQFVWKKLSIKNEPLIQFTTFTKTIDLFAAIMIKGFPEFGLKHSCSFLQRTINNKNAIDSGSSQIEDINDAQDNDAKNSANFIAFPIATYEQLDKLEIKLRNPQYKWNLIQKFYAVIKTKPVESLKYKYGQTGHLLLCLMFMPDFLKQFVWARQSNKDRSLPKFRLYTNTISLFARIMNKKLPEYSLRHAQTYLKQYIKRKKMIRRSYLVEGNIDELDLNQCESSELMKESEPELSECESEPELLNETDVLSNDLELETPNDASMDIEEIFVEMLDIEYLED